MQRYWLTRLADHELIHEVTKLVAHERRNTADLLAHLAEVDARKLYAPAGYDSMYAWCMKVLQFSEDVACKRIEAARTARRFPAIFEAIADGRLHVSGVLVLAPHLTHENASELLAAAANRSRAQIMDMLAERFPRPDVSTLLAPLAVASLATGTDDATEVLSAPGRINFTPPAHVDVALPAPPSAAERIRDRGQVTPLSADRVALQVTLARSTADQLRYAQALLGHAIAPGDVAAVIDRAVNALVEQLEKRRFAKGARASTSHRTSRDPRHIPAHVRREVFERDHGRCTFVSADGHACGSQRDLEFDHHVPVARGGQATAANVRLRCSTHNQHAADLAFGAGFMQAKRDGARVRRAERRACSPRETAPPRAAAPGASARTCATMALVDRPRAASSARADLRPASSPSATPDPAPTPDPECTYARAAAADATLDITNALRNLGARKEEICRALEHTAHLANAPLRARLLAALRTLRPANVKTLRPESAGATA